MHNQKALSNELEQLSETVDVTKVHIQKALKSGFKDFEDAIQYNCAKEINKIDCIVTRNSKDFKLSSIPIMRPEEALSLVESSIRKN